MSAAPGRRILVLLAVGALAVGLVAELVAAPRIASTGFFDALAGWSLVACGLAGWARRPESRIGPLLVGAGFAWFLGNFEGVEPPLVGGLCRATNDLYLAVLAHALLTFPTGRITTRLERWAVPIGYLAAIGVSLRPGAITNVATATLLTLALILDRRDHPPTFRRVRQPALVVGLGWAAVIGVSAVAQLLLPLGGALDAPLLTRLAVTIGAVALLAGLLGLWSMDTDVTDLVVELGSGHGGELESALAVALADPGVRVGYWLPAVSRYVDVSGAPMTLDAGPGRAITRIDRDDGPVAILLHDPAILDDLELRDAIATAARLAASNARLRAAVGEQVAEVGASRRRLVDAGDAERQALEARLHDGAEPGLLALGETITQARALAGPNDRLARAADQLEVTRAELRELALGIHPRVLSERGLAGALTDLAARSSVPATVRVDGTDALPADVEATLYFLCSEAVANAVKHASAAHITIEVRLGGGVASAAVADDGSGGADPSAGTGLRGLRDRIEALGGTLVIASPVGAGTRLVATLPA